MDLQQQLPKGKLEKKIYLPPENFSYGIKNLPSTPIKHVINYDYSNVAEEKLKRSYSQLIIDRSKIEKSFPKTRIIFEKIQEEKKREKSLKEEKKNKKVYKIKKFLNVESKVMESLQKFKTYLPNIFRNSMRKDDLDDMIVKIQNDINALDQKQSII